MNRSWDVIVVGARVAGAATAMLLARAGLRVLCVDRSRYGTDTVSTHALMRGGVMQLQRWGLLDEVIARGTPAVRRTVFHYGNETVGISIKPSAGVDALYAPRRTVIDPLLVDAARRAGATVEFGATVSDVLRDDSGRVNGVSVRDEHGRAVRQERAALVIGADGRNSLIATAVGAQLQSVGRNSGSYLYGYWSDLPTDGYEWIYQLGLTAGMIPTNDGLTCVFLGARRENLNPAVRSGGPVADTFRSLAHLAGFGDRLDHATLAGSIRHGRRLPPGYLREAYGPGWALVGDAGHWMDPMSTHGITSALRDAELLAIAVVGGIARRRPGELDLADYQTVRDRISRPMMAHAEVIAGFEWDLTEIRSVLRGMASAMAEEVEAIAEFGAESAAGVPDVPPAGIAKLPEPGTAPNMATVPAASVPVTPIESASIALPA